MSFCAGFSSERPGNFDGSVKQRTEALKLLMEKTFDGK